MGILRRHGFYTTPRNWGSLKDRALRLKMETNTALQKKRERMEAELIAT